MCAKRDPQATRTALLTAAAGEIYESGFQSASMDDILRSAGVTKGALYHHFANKRDLGYAVLDEVIAQGVYDAWVKPLRECVDPIDALHTILSNAAEMGHLELRRGCPLNNLAQEMAGVDEGFQERIAAVCSRWQAEIAGALERGQAGGYVRPDLDPVSISTFLVAAVQGSIGLAKSCQCPETFERSKSEFCRYLESLRPVPANVSVAN
ncbi:MAG: TetR/AcrR family transcriptional regulator [Acidobacteriota bacterium]